MVNIILLFCIWHLVGVFGDRDAVKSVSVMEGDSVTLNPDLTDIQRDEQIEWRFENIRIATVIMNNPKYYDNDERFRDRLKLDQTGSLTISDIRTTDSGLYKLSTIIRSKEFIKRFKVTVNESDQQTPSLPPVSVSLIVPISSAVAGSLMIVAAVGIFWICKKHRQTDQQVQTRDEEITYADPMFYKRNAQKAEEEVVYAGVVTKR
ncbi:unnamed protein product [Leuciscus chuanchicus]